MGELLRWLDTHDAAAPAAALERAGAVAAERQLEGVTGLDARNRGTTYMSAAALLAAYRHPSVLAAEPQLEAADGEPLTASALLDGRANTLYIVASERRQRLLAPLIVAIVSSLLHEAAERANAGRRTSPTLRLLIDEAANIAPLRELPRHISEAAGNGVRIATVWQSLAQLRQRYGDAADTILAGSTAKLFMGPVSDETTRRYLASSLGDEPVTTRSTTSGSGHTSRTEGQSWRPRAAADALQQLGGERAVLFNGALPPAVVRLLPWWQDGELKRRAALQAAA